MTDGSSGEVDVYGWIRSARESKNFAFLQISDGSCTESMQAVFSTTEPAYQEQKAALLTGAAVKVTGTLVPSQGKGQSVELQASRVQVLGASDSSYPLQKKGHTLEFLREHLALRPRTNTIGAVSRVRSEASFAIHEFFRQHGFFYIHAPIITGADCEGAGETFRVSTSAGDEHGGFFGRPAYLSVSGQLHAECYATALGRVYTFGPTFRAENSNTTRHLAEFWMIEPEMAFFNLQDNIALAFAFVRSVIQSLMTHCDAELTFLHEREWCPPGLRAVLENVLTEELVVIDYTEAIKILEKAPVSFAYAPTWGADLQTEHERYLTEQHVKKPVAVINYPLTLKPFYMRVNDDGKTVRAMDVLVPGLGEIIGGSQREERLDVLLERMKNQGLLLEEYQWFSDLRRFGTVEHSGFGLGFERLLMYVTGMQNIRDVIGFPRFPGHVEC